MRTNKMSREAGSRSAGKYKVNFEIEFKKNSFGGKFIAIEGNEGSGKTTQAHEIVKRLEEKGVKAIYTKEPTGSVVGKLIREVLGGKYKIPPQSLQYLFAADRSIHQDEIENYLKEGKIVVTDRYFWSAVAYGIADMKKDLDYTLTAYSILSFYNQFIAPDFTILLDVKVDEAIVRISKSSKHTEIYDEESMIKKVDETYRDLVKKFPNEFTVIDANQKAEDITNQILAKLSS